MSAWSTVNGPVRCHFRLNPLISWPPRIIIIISIINSDIEMSCPRLRAVLRSFSAFFFFLVLFVFDPFFLSARSFPEIQNKIFFFALWVVGERGE